jgi:hypothetical protein
VGPFYSVQNEWESVKDLPVSDLKSKLVMLISQMVCIGFNDGRVKKEGGAGRECASPALLRQFEKPWDWKA